MATDDQRLREDTADELGQAISRGLFRAGLDMNYALMVVGDGSPAAARLSKAIDAVDRAIVDLRHLMLALQDTPGDAHPTGCYRDR
jgi:hypothetical protein